MPSELNHLSTAIDNHQLAYSLLDENRSLAWATTVAFYSALHLVEASFARNGEHYDQHASRNNRLKHDLHINTFGSITSRFMTGR